MSPSALIDEMGVDNVGFLIENLGADAAPLQYLRELVQNEIEAIQAAQVPEGSVEIDYDEVEGVKKLRISGNGCGMTSEEVALNLNRLSASGGIQAFDKNFGIGAKITAGTRNPHGVVYKSWKNGAGSVTVLGRSDGSYGRLAVKLEDGSVEYSLPLPTEDKHPVIAEHGTSVVLLGRSREEDTFTRGPDEAELPSQWVAAYLERRYFAFPEHVSVRALRPVEIYDAEKGRSRAIYDTIRGQQYYLDKHSDYRGRRELPGAKATVWWWLLGEEITQGGKTWNNHGHVAALYQNELYEIHSGASRTSALKDFGIYAGFGRIVLYVEPHNVLKANTSRTALILKDSRPIDYAEIGAAFVDDIPGELAAFMAGQVSAERGDHRKAIRKALKEVDDALDQARYRRSRRGRIDHYDAEAGGMPAPTFAEVDERAADRRRRSGDAAGRLGSEYLRRAREEREKRMRGEVAEADPAPKIVWDKDGTTVPAGRAATYVPRLHLVTASTRYPFYLDMLEWALEEAKNRGAADMDEEALKKIVEDEVQRWFDQAFTEVVVVLRPMAHDEKWGPKVYDTALSDEGLTAAVVSHRWHMISAIKRGLAGRLGRQKDAVA